MDGQKAAKTSTRRMLEATSPLKDPGVDRAVKRLVERRPPLSYYTILMALRGY